MEAMAAGVPVILPPEFAPTFGAAALYAAPDEVWPLVERLWRDRGVLGGARRRGPRLRARDLRLRRLPARLARLAAAPARAAAPEPDAAPRFSVDRAGARASGSWCPALLAALAAQTLAARALRGDRRQQRPAPGPRARRLALPPATPGVVACPAPGSYAARNAGAAAARGGLARLHRRRLPPDARLARGLRRRRGRGPPAALLAGPVRMTAAGPPERLRDLRPGPRHPPGALRRPRLRRHRQSRGAGGGLRGPRRLRRRRASPAATPSSAAAPAAPAIRSGWWRRRWSRIPAATDWAALAAKARRIKGGQIAAGPLPRRLAWILRTLAPPLADTRAYLAAAAPARATA